jgi:hypothetical protein
MKHKKGFLLIECCVYLAICAILTVTIMHWITQTVSEAGRSVQSTDRALTNILVHDVLARDLQSAPSNRVAWVETKPHYIVWKMNESNAIGWYVVNGGQLVRKEGVYNAALQQWGKHHTSTVTYGVRDFLIEIHIDGDTVQGVTTAIALQASASCVRYVRLRNGRVV